MSDDAVALFQAIGLSEQKAKETAANKKLSPNLVLVIKEGGAETGVEKSVGALYYNLASTVTKNAVAHLPYLARAVRDARLTTNDQVSAAIKFAEAAKGDIDDGEFDAACGVGIVVTQQEIVETVTKFIEERREELEQKRYQMLGSLISGLRQTPELRWASSVAVKEEIDKQVLQILGPKDERDDPKAKKKAEKKDVKAPAAATKEKQAKTETAAAASKEGRVAEAAKSLKYVFEGELARLHKPGGNPQIHPKLMEEHLKRTGGKVVTRFPPEPNGFLHIGHAKAININFGYALAHEGITNLRYDDTNPEAEEEKYFVSILETIKWLGFEPSAITYSSDHFQRLYDLAVELIKRDKAYVCHCTGEEIHAMREANPRIECAHRSRPVDESVREFVKMKEGRYGEGEAILRMKMDMQNPNPQFWDLVAYRVMFTPHHRTGNAWCVYPTYDYTHCLCDSFEDITHSLCTVEFQLSRESYYWLVDALELYKPVQWEYGRLNITNTVLSKRKITKLVDEGIVGGWDDPRLYTLPGLRRRGFPATAINAFVRELGVTTSNTVIPVERLENYVRDHLNDVAPRLMVLLEPLKITLTNLSDDYLEEVTVANKPRDESMGSHTVPFSKTVYIDASDFREQDDPNFYRLAPGKSVGLLNVPFPITANKVVKDSSGRIVEILATYENSKADFKKPKTYIHWVGESKKHNSPVKVQVNLYSNLFKHSNPADNPDGWLADINPDSLSVIPEAYAEIGIRGARIEDSFQFVRVGYFSVDPDSDVKKGRYVVNRTVGLKEDAKKN
ncbi:tRNA synthetases class I, catalytic domain-containing protein [Polychytrium aggregatum]|uniref:tRNA synthetases class I, catalytic domain-containing protein n=1 Tax=Polychytrium aggregatum TaxID=110093 RepID=UPI0022FF4030|nr:tRNA synthetases class I, catalytic domain-containing protein [Polychytrium aggregatum]KAI9208216.1 tRNA synthetases class I, catalytic domain-containing protein [Polychytrium aggregatum]